MILLDGLLQKYLNYKDIDDCSCTLPYENLSYFDNLSLFSYYVFILSPSSPYPQYCSIHSDSRFNRANSESVFPTEVLEGTSQKPRETEMYVLLPGFESVNGRTVGKCVFALINGRFSRHDCALLTDQSTINDFISDFDGGAEGISFENVCKDDIYEDISVTLISSSSRSTKVVRKSSWIDEENEDIEEEW